MKQFIIVAMLCSIYSKSWSQSSTGQIFIGSKVDNLVIKNLLNYEKKESKISDLHDNKLLILDFFATWCKPCVAELPKMDSLQNKLKDRVQIMAVTDQQNELIGKFLQLKFPRLSYPFAAEDTALKNRFHYLILPHVVWINKEGVVVAITSNKEVTEDNIRKVAEQKQVSFEEKKDADFFDSRRPLFFDGNGGDGKNFLYRSVLLKADKGLPSGGFAEMNWLKEDSLRLKRYLGFNRTPLSLFLIAFNLGGAEGTVKKRMLLDVADTSKYTGTSGMKPKRNELKEYEEWFWQNAYSYEMIVPEAIKDTVFFQQMFQDLNRYFPLKAKVIYKEISCLELVRTRLDEGLLKTLGQPTAFIKTSPKTLGRMQNISLEKLVGFLNRFDNIDPVVNETGFTDHVDLDVNISYGSEDDFFDHLDIAKLRESLSKYGLDLVPKKRMMKVLLLTDKMSLQEGMSQTLSLK